MYRIMPRHAKSEHCVAGTQTKAGEGEYGYGYLVSRGQTGRSRPWLCIRILAPARRLRQGKKAQKRLIAQQNRPVVLVLVRAALPIRAREAKILLTVT